MLFTFVLFLLLIKIAISTEEKDESQIAGAPSELRVYSASDSVQISWLPPIDDNVMIRAYQIGWGINVPDIEKITVNNDVREYTIRGLKPNREYVISLRAFNNVGQGFPIYETVKTNFYGKITTELPSFRENLITPVGLFAETLSNSQIKLSWIDANENAFNQLYTVRYGLSGNSNEQSKMLNTTDTEYIFDGLRPDTQYEFAVKLANTQHWSLTAINRTFPIPPSSSPRDLTVTGQQTTRDNATTVTLTWQPPKYANGEIREYIVLYTDNFNTPEHEWNMESVRGDRLSMFIHGLQPGKNYYFKVQARNIKGYGPFSSMVSFISPAAEQNLNAFEQQIIEKSNISLYHQTVKILSANVTNFLFGAVTIIFIVLIIILIIVCASRTRKHTTGKNLRTKHTARQKKCDFDSYPPADLWNQQNCGRFEALINTNEVNFGITTASNGAQGFLMLDNQNRAFITPGNPLQHMNSPIIRSHRHAESLPYQANQLARNYNCSTLVSPNEQLLSYHESYQNHQTPETARNQHIVYRKTDREAITKANFPDEDKQFNENCGSLSEIQVHEIDDFHSPSSITDAVEKSSNGYQIVRNYASTMNSFTPSNQCAPLSKLQNQKSQQKIAHVVRPIISANVVNSSSPSVVRNSISQKTPIIGSQITRSTGKVPIGRATAQPRVNIVNAADSSTSPYSSVRVQREREPATVVINSEQMKTNIGTSSEELNVHEIDQMIDTLQQLQHEFTTTITDD